MVLVCLLGGLLATACNVDKTSRALTDAGQDETAAELETDVPISDEDVKADELETCRPGELWCADDIIIECDSEGTWVQQSDCSKENKVCAAGKCRDLSPECAKSMNERSYIGCEYLAAPLANTPLNYNNGKLIPGEPFNFAVAIANDNAAHAKIEISDGEEGEVQNFYEVPAGEMIVVDDLPWKKLIKDPYTSAVYQARIFATRQIPNAAYYIRSDLPITVYQFNPLQYRAMVDEEEVFSFSNDASLLLPTHVFLDEYMAIARPTQKLTSVFDGIRTDNVSPGFISIVGPNNGPTTLEITTTAATYATDQQSVVSYPALAPGQTLEAVTLRPLEVLQILSANEPGCVSPKICDEAQYTDIYGKPQVADISCCKAPRQFDLTGTTIKVLDGPAPAVFAGHNCTFVPFDRFACDHLEQQMFPMATWGTHYLCAHTITERPEQPSIWRIISGADENTITFTPGSIHQDITLNKGDFIEFESRDDFEISGSGRFAVAQFLVGQKYTGDINTPQNGDPAMAIVVPLAQYRRTYTFLAPDTYAHNYLSVIHKTGEFPLLDGFVIAGDTADIGEDYSRTNLEIEGGIHSMSSTYPFGVTVMGVGSYTSYMYPAGLDLHRTVVF